MRVIKYGNFYSTIFSFYLYLWHYVYVNDYNSRLMELSSVLTMPEAFEIVDKEMSEKKYSPTHILYASNS